jgi:serine/threonine-protein kinase PknK
MPAPVEHASAFALGRYAYVVGGRGSGEGSQTAAVVAIDSASGRATRVAELPQPLSDAGVAVGSGRVWVAGGRGTGGVLDSIVELEPAAR